MPSYRIAVLPGDGTGPEVVREGLILNRHDPVLLGIVPRRLDVEVVEGQEEPFRPHHRLPRA